MISLPYSYFNPLQDISLDFLICAGLTPKTTIWGVVEAGSNHLALFEQFQLNCNGDSSIQESKEISTAYCQQIVWLIKNLAEGARQKQYIHCLCRHVSSLLLGHLLSISLYHTRLNNMRYHYCSIYKAMGKQ